MNKDNLIIYVSSKNNYDMLEGEILKNVDREGFEFINIDDKSCSEEIEKGKNICSKHNIVFLENKSKGVQMATQTLIDFINQNRPKCKYIICFQHDVVPISKDFFKTISTYISEEKLDEFGGIGFNVIDNGKYTYDSYNIFKSGKYPLGMIGLAHLSIASEAKRFLTPAHNKSVLEKNLEKWSKPFIIEFPAWMCVGINVNSWNKSVIPTEQYEFHLWFPDIAMQFNKANKPLLVIPNLYCLNQQEVKSKYGISENSAHGSKNGEEYHFGKYSNFDAWKQRWGWDYRNAKNTFEETAEKYEGTILYEYYKHNIDNGPLKNYNL